MSKRRKVGDWVYIRNAFGDQKAIATLRFEIQPEEALGEPWWCTLGCKDEDCVEWTTMLSEPDSEGDREYVYHCNECEMSDEPWKRS